MDSLKNLKVVNLCWGCAKPHNDIAYKFNKRDKTITCDCGGNVVTRSGKVRLAIVPVIPVWLVDDGETHRWAANSIEAVRSAHKEIYGEELDSETVVRQIVSPEEFTRKFIMDEQTRRLRSINDILSKTEEFPALISTSVW